MMRTKSAEEIIALDEELNLFDESDWSFMSVIETQDSNYEYFNDIRDDDFAKRRFSIRDVVMPIVCVVSVLTMCAVGVASALRDDGYDRSRYDEMQTVGSALSVVQYIDGRDATSEELVEVTKLMASYFSTLGGRSDYQVLYRLCKPTSSFADTYYKAVDCVEYAYDTSDCYARMIRELAGSFSLNKVTRVIEKDGVFYCYASINYPTLLDVTEFIYLYNYNFLKEFQGGSDISESNVIRYMLSLLQENTISCTSTEVCFKCAMSSGELAIVDDTFVVSACMEGYSVAVSQLVDILGGQLSN